MQSEPLVTIITPTFNHAEYIRDCIESVQNQSYKNWEQIIIDDGSSDNTFKIASEIAANDPRIKVIYQDNVGLDHLGDTYNKAYELAKGQWLAILEGDDCWEPDKLQYQIDDLRLHQDAILSWGLASMVKAKSMKEIKIFPEKLEADMNRFFNTPTGNILNVLYEYNCIPALTLMIKKSALDQIGGFIQKEGIPLVDFPTILNLAVMGPFRFCNKKLGSWRVYSEQTTKTHTAKIIIGCDHLLKDFLPRTEVIPKEVFKLNASVFRKKVRSNYVIAYSRNGRYELIRKNYSLARSYYFKSIFTYPLTEPLWKVRSVVGLLFSLLRMDVEWLASKVGKGSIN